MFLVMDQHIGVRIPGGAANLKSTTYDLRIPQKSYDHNGALVDEHHPFSGCRGTPNQYDSSQHPILYALIDSGGIVRSGGPAFFESRVYEGAEALGGLENAIKRLYGVPF